MKNKSSIFYCFLLLVIAVGCAVLKPTKQNTENQTKVSKQEQKAEAISKQIESNKEEKIRQSAVYAYGVSYSLGQIEQPSIEVITASKLNDRVISIVGAPDLKESERIKKTIDLLNSEIQIERLKGEKLLIEKDKEIFSLQKAQKDLEQKYEQQIQNTITEAKKSAKNADEANTTLNSMSGMLGLNAIFWGLKKFLIGSLTWVIVFCIVFLVLRLLSATNPIAASIFSIFNVIGSSVLNVLKSLTPKAFELSNFVRSEEKVKYKKTLVKIIDVIQEFKEDIKRDPKKEYSLLEILNKLNADMDEDEKDLIDEILIEEKWRKK